MPLEHLLHERALGEALADARAAAERALTLDADHVTGLVALGWVRRTADWDWKGADRLFERAQALAPGDAYRLIGTAFLRNRRGDPEGHRAIMEDFVARFGAEMPGYAAVQYALAGDTESAFAWLDRAVQRRDAAAAWVKTNNGYRSLHADPRWPALLRKLGQADDQLR